MKLIDLLVQELPKRGGWPYSIKFSGSFIAQDKSGEVWLYPLKPKHSNSGRWLEDSGDGKYIGDYHIASDCDLTVVSRESYEAALAASKVKEWDGDGIPPVGCECEYTMNGGATWWTCTVKYIVGKSGLVMACDCYGGEQYVNFSNYKKEKSLIFRPIRTEAEIKRDEFALAISNKAIMGESWQMQHVARDIYDAIASGKIPGVKIE